MTSRADRAEEPPIDGRRARSEQTQAAIVDAVIALYREGNLTPRIDDIAAQVGVSARAVYNHYPDHEALAVAVGKRQFVIHRELFSPTPATGSLIERIDALAHHRAALYEAISPVRRAAVLSMHRSAVVSEQQRAVAAALRRQLAATFEPELAKTPPPTLDALDLATSWEAWDRLRDRQGLDIGAARAVVADLVSRTLAR